MEEIAARIFLNANDKCNGHRKNDEMKNKN